MFNSKNNNSDGNRSVNFDFGKALLNKNGGWFVPDNAIQSFRFSKIFGEDVGQSESLSWFWTVAWQKGEQNVEKLIQSGDFETFNTMEEFLSTLGE